VFHQIETVGILVCAKHPDLAQAFIDYVLTVEFQATIPDTQAIYPIIEGVDMPETYNELATDPEDLEPAPFTAVELGMNVESWVQEWEDIFQDHYA
jgi:thiamine transport system substrate-binding protein